MIFAERPGRRVSELVDQKMIANQQRVFHRTRRNHEGLDQRRRAEKQKQDRDCPFSNTVPNRLSSYRGVRRPPSRGVFTVAVV